MGGETGVGGWGGWSLGEVSGEAKVCPCCCIIIIYFIRDGEFLPQSTGQSWYAHADAGRNETVAAVR